MTLLETLLEDPEQTLALLDLELPLLPSAQPERVGVNRFGNGPFSNWSNWDRFGNR